MHGAAAGRREKRGSQPAARPRRSGVVVQPASWRVPIMGPSSLRAKPPRCGNPGVWGRARPSPAQAHVSPMTGGSVRSEAAPAPRGRVRRVRPHPPAPSPIAMGEGEKLVGGRAKPSPGPPDCRGAAASRWTPPPVSAPARAERVPLGRRAGGEAFRGAEPRDRPALSRQFPGPAGEASRQRVGHARTRRALRAEMLRFFQHCALVAGRRIAAPPASVRTAAADVSSLSLRRGDAGGGADRGKYRLGSARAAATRGSGGGPSPPPISFPPLAPRKLTGGGIRWKATGKPPRRGNPGVRVRAVPADPAARCGAASDRNPRLASAGTRTGIGDGPAR